MRAGVVVADVAGFEAAAGGSVALEAGFDFSAGDFFEAAGVGAAGFFGSGDEQLFLRADFEQHSVRGGDPGQLGGERLFFFGGGIPPFESFGPGRGVEVAAGLLVDLREGDHHLVGSAAQGFGQAAEVFLVEARRGEGGENDRVVAPHQDSGTVSSGDRVRVFDRPARVEHRGFELSWIAVDGVLHQEGEAAFLHFRQVAQEGADVFGPEDDAVDLFRQQRNPIGPDG